MAFPKEGKYVKGYVYEPDKKENLYPYFDGNRDNIKRFLVPYKGMEIEFTKITDIQNNLLILENMPELMEKEKIYIMNMNLQNTLIFN